MLKSIYDYLKSGSGRSATREQSSQPKSHFMVALGLVACSTVATQLLVSRAFDAQDRAARAVLASGQQHLLGRKLTTAAHSLQNASGAGPFAERAAEVLGLVDDWLSSHTHVRAELAIGPTADHSGRQILEEATLGEDPRVKIQELARRARPAGNEDFDRTSLDALAVAILEEEPRLQQETADLLAANLNQVQSARGKLKRTGIAIVLTTLLVLVLQSSIVFGQALRVIRQQSAREKVVLQEQRHIIDRISRTSDLILNSAGEAIWGVDREGSTTFVNPAAASAIGWEVSELLDASQHSILRHSNKDGTPYDEAACPVCRAFREGTSHHAADDVFWKKDGTNFPAEYRSTPIHEAGQVVGAVLTFKNVSEHRMLHSKLVQAQKLESIGQLAAGIAHEINTPTQYVGDNTRFLKDAFGSLNQLVSACDKLLQAAKQDALTDDLVREVTELAEAADIAYLNEEIPKAIDQSLEGIGRVARIVRAMKDFSHPDSGSKVPTDLNKAIESTVTVARNEWKYVADLELDLDPGLPPVSCLPGDLNQVILNLVINAAHAIGDVIGDGSQGKGTIRVSTRCENEQAVIRISDTGAGIPPAIRSKIFDPFFTTKPVGKGTGQGLSIAYSVIVEKHGGTIGFESELRQGTTFVIHLPMNENASPDEGAAHEAANCAG